jgi:prevent-host-death family protein
MYTYTLSEARNRHGEIFDRAATEPVLLTRQSRPSHVLLSATAYTKLIDKLAELEEAT